jgi:riboflavin kinase / FMN adenylyltransferase
MQIINRLDEIEKPIPNAIVTIGNFDGVHIGHQALMHTVIEKAHAVGGTAVAITFDPHPIRVLATNGHPPLITLTEQKTELIAKAGIDTLISIPFDREFAAIAPREFVADLLVGRIGMKALAIGRDYTFGRKREGNLKMLQQWAPELGYEVMVVDWIRPSDNRFQRISSTRIRELVMAGDMDGAKRLLGRNYQIRGVVATGRDRGGKLLGFPTANINLQDELSPKTGVYAVTVEHDDKILEGVANIGYSPTFDDHLFTVEVHILDFDQNIYGESIRVNFIQRLRGEIKFDSIDALADQIRIDIKKAREFLHGIR